MNRKILGLMALEAGFNFKHEKLVKTLLDPKFDDRANIDQRLCQELGLSNRQLLQQASQNLEKYTQQKIGILVFGEADYPQNLIHIDQPPLVLFYMGKLQNLNQLNCISIVGARNADKNGVEIAQNFARELASLGLCVVSGLALGIDTYAHLGALQTKSGIDSKVPTIAVLGNGLPNIYPSSNQKLARQIIEQGGLILSHFLPETPAYPSNFLDRNRLVAGISLATLVVQAAKRSGSLATARHAMEFGREVMACPGAVGDQRFEGTNNLIKQGAACVTCVEDILQLLPQLNLKVNEKNLDFENELTDLNPAQQKIIKMIKQQRKANLEELIQKLKLPSEDLSSELTELELLGIVERAPGNYYELAS